MRHRYLLLAASLLAASGAMAEQRTENDARRLATQYLAAQRLDVKADDLRLMNLPKVEYATSRARQNAEHALTTPYYVYNRPQGGFVVVSGTTNLDPVIAFSETGSIDTTGPMPEGLSYWFSFAAEAADFIEQHPEAKAPHPADARPYHRSPGITYADNIDYRKDITPLLQNSRIGKISWSQDAPFFNDCPTQGGRHCYTGCMATAMSQIMAYHQHPVHPEGWVGGKVYLDAETYDWSKVRGSYKGGQGTTEERAEVAKINYHVGLSLQMEYGTDQSGSVSTMYARALRDNFGYHENVALINRDNYTYGEWVDILLTELMAGRPVLYDGVSNSGGHAFILDGYRASDGFFNVNWGWEGTSDGYYNVIMLDPATTGVGALVGGFTSYQDAVVGIEPDVSKRVNYHLPVQGHAMQGELVVGTGTAELAQGDRNGYLSFANMPNLRTEQFTGEYGALFINMQGEEVARVKAGTVTGAAANMNSNPHANPSGGYFITPELPDGEYYVYCYLEDDLFDQWGVLRTSIDTPNFMHCTISGNGAKAFYSIDKHNPTGLKVTKWSFDEAAPRYGTSGVSVTIQNTGEDLEYGSFALSVDIPNTLSHNYFKEFYRFLPGETKTITFPVEFNEYGEYVIRSFELYRLNGGGSASIIEPASVTFNVSRSVAELRVYLNNRLDDVQAILDHARLSGSYSAEACAALQQVIDAVKAAAPGAGDADALNALVKQLEEALDAFYKSLTIDDSMKTYKGYVSGNLNQLDKSWTPGGTKPLYCAISLDESDLSAYVGGQIVGLRCCFGRTTKWSSFSGDDMEVKVFLLDYDGSYPGSQILATSKTQNPAHYNAYDDYLFDVPYTIGNGGVLCVAEVCTPKMGGMFGAMGATSQVTTAGACWLNNGNGWEDMYGSYGSEAHGHGIMAIIVGGTDVTDAKLTNGSANSVAVGEDIVLKARLQNLSKNTVKATVLNWKDDEGHSGETTINRNIPSGETIDVSVPVPALETAKLHSFTLSVATLDGVEDQIAANSTLTIKVPVTAHKYTRRVVLEENTGTNCGYCPRGIATFEYMKEKYPDTFIPVSIHHFNAPGADPMYYEGNNYTPLFVYLNNAPSGMLNRSEKAYTNMNKADVESLYLEQMRTCIARIDAEAYYDETTGNVAVITETEFGYDYSAADYRISYLILEDKVGPHSQSNYYSYGMGMNLGSMDGWESKPTNVPMIYDDVLREQLPAYTGKSSSVPWNGKGGEAYTYRYGFKLPSTVKNVENVRIVTLLLDLSTREILNAAQTPLVLEVPEGIHSVLADDAEASDESYDLSGRRVAGNAAGAISITGGRKVIK